MNKALNRPLNYTKATKRVRCCLTLAFGSLSSPGSSNERERARASVTVH
jgi:hypothetical protein